MMMMKLVMLLLCSVALSRSQECHHGKSALPQRYPKLWLKSQMTYMGQVTE